MMRPYTARVAICAITSAAEQPLQFERLAGILKVSFKSAAAAVDQLVAAGNLTGRMAPFRGAQSAFAVLEIQGFCLYLTKNRPQAIIKYQEIGKIPQPPGLNSQRIVHARKRS